MAPASVGMKPGWSVIIKDSPESTADEKTEMPDYIKLSRTWKDIPNEAFIGRFPTEKEITRWKKEFEKAHAVDSVWHGQLGLYKDAKSSHRMTGGPNGASFSTGTIPTAKPR